MAYESLRITAGVDVEKTLADNAAGISESQYIRWRDKLPEKRGGWSKYINAVFAGIVRALHAWQGLNNDKRLAVGSTTNLYVVENGNVGDITAQKTDATVAVSLTTTIGSSLVLVDDTGSNATIYDSVVFNTHASVGGVTLYGLYRVAQASGADAYYIDCGIEATGAVTGGGAVTEFSVTSGSSIVEATLADHTFAVGDAVAFPVSTTVGGITIYGQYLVLTVPTADTFTFNASNEATSTTTGFENGGDLSLTYWITPGPAISGTGYGIGGYGDGGYGTGTPSPTHTGTPITATDYTLSNWGETLISCPEGGPLFAWSATSGLQTSSIIDNCPVVNSGALVAMPQQQVMAWGSTYTGIADPLRIRWSDSGNYTVWTAQATNQAGGYLIPTGSKIIRGLQGPNQCYWWTDVDLYVSQYIGTPYVWGFNKIASGCGLIAPQAVASLNTGIFWMSQKQFFMTSSGVGAAPIPCSVWDFVFQNLNLDYVQNIRAGANSQFNEVSWFFPSAASNSGENDSFVTLNVLYNEWDYGSIRRTAWIDQSILGPPIGSDNNGYLQQHETSNDADGEAMTAYCKTGYYSIANGQELVFVDRILPDMKWGQYSEAQTAELKISFNVTDYAGDTPRTYGPFTFSKDTEWIDVRFRGRFVQIIVESNDLGSFWRWGSTRYRFAPAGRR
jgi:hypothetical protein